MKRVLVWDLWVRLFHWMLVLAIVVSFYTMKTEGYPLLFPVDWHARAGYVVLGLMVFRWLWGLVGSHHARFTSFLHSTPRSVDYARAFLSGRAQVYAGHNPLGGWMVLVMLVSLTLQAGSGLFLHDDILFEAPFYGVLGDETTKTLAAVHRANGNLLLGLVVLHLLAIVAHRLKGERLVGAMFSGRKRLASEPPDGRGTAGAPWRALAAVAIAAAVVVWLWTS